MIFLSAAVSHFVLTDDRVSQLLAPGVFEDLSTSTGSRGSVISHGRRGKKVFPQHNAAMRPHKSGVMEIRGKKPPAPRLPTREAYHTRCIQE